MPDLVRPAPSIVVIMGVTGSGKSTIARLLADRLGWDLCEGDDLHSAEAKAIMATGQALSDAQRQPWLDHIKTWVAAHLDVGRPGIVAASVLKKQYRRSLGDQRVTFVHLTGTANLLAERLAKRKEHFASPALLPSQLAALEAPTNDERHLRLDIAKHPDDLADEIVDHLQLKPSRQETV